MEILTYEKIYDLIHATLKEDIDFFKDELANSGNVLELGCGTGRILIPLLQAGIDCWGLDISPEMLSICRENLKRREIGGAENRLHQGDMRRFSLDKKFSSIIIPFNTFLYLESYKAQSQCLQAIHEHLVDEGRLIIDVFNPLYILSSRQEGVLYHEFSTFHEQRQSLINFYSSCFFLDNYFHWNQFFEELRPEGVKKFFRKMVLKALFETEIYPLARAHGFSVKAVYGSYSKEKTGRQKPNLIFKLAKPE